MEGTGGSSQTEHRGTDTGSSPGFAVTRRTFLIGAGAGAAAGAVLGGAAVVATRAISPPTTAPTAAGVPPVAALPASMRRVTLDIDGAPHSVVVDVRESLWETMTYQLGMSGANLGCDRAQCGACTVVVDGKAVNGCTVLSARLGRGQEILTVAGLPKGSGLAGLHPIQRAFWLDGGYQCGICTRGFIMSTYALLTAVPKPTRAQIAEGLAGNICRCGEYLKIFKAVETAAADMRGEKVTYLAKAPTLDAAAAAPAAPVVAGTTKLFEFSKPLGTIEEFDEIADHLRRRDGILGVSGSERTITLRWDPAKLSEAQVREVLAQLRYPLK